MYKKGQAAMEFLMTYGWALLVVIAAVGALAYFGILSPDAFLPEKCQGPSGLDCAGSAAVDSSGQGIVMPLTNNLGQDIEVVSVKSVATECAGATSDGYAKPSKSGVWVTLTEGTTKSGKISRGQAFQVAADCPFDVEAGSKFAGQVTVKYEVVESGFENAVTYEIRGTVKEIGTSFT